MNQDKFAAVNGGGSHHDFFVPRWYVLFVRSHQEKNVVHSLRQRGIEHLLPCYSSVRQWKDRRVRLELPLFPGYVFVYVPLADRLQVLTIPYVVSLVGRKDAPATISCEEIDWIRSGSAYGKAEPHAYLRVGQRVMISTGSFAGMRGILQRRSNGLRLVVSLESIVRAFTVEVDEGSVESLHCEIQPASPTLSHTTSLLGRTA
jgi:transcription antitermination factor NusG